MRTLLSIKVSLQQSSESQERFNPHIPPLPGDISGDILLLELDDGCCAIGLSPVQKPAALPTYVPQASLVSVKEQTCVRETISGADKVTTGEQCGYRSFTQAIKPSVQLGDQSNKDHIHPPVCRAQLHIQFFYLVFFACHGSFLPPSSTPFP